MCCNRTQECGQPKGAWIVPRVKDIGTKNGDSFVKQTKDGVTWGYKWRGKQQSTDRAEVSNSVATRRES